MRWFHVIRGDEVAAPRKGLVVRLFGAGYVDLLVVIPGFGKRLFLEDFNNTVAERQPSYWAVLSFEPNRWPRVFGGIEGIKGEGDRVWRIARRHL